MRDAQYSKIKQQLELNLQIGSTEVLKCVNFWLRIPVPLDSLNEYPVEAESGKLCVAPTTSSNRANQ